MVFSPGLQVGRQVEHVIVQAARLAADRAAKDLLPVDEQQIARVGGDAGRRSLRDAVEVEGLAKEAVRLLGRRVDIQTRKGSRV